MRKLLFSIAVAVASCGGSCAPGQAKAEWRPAERWRGFNLLEMFIWHEGVKMPEFGVYNKTPHDIALKMLEANLMLLKERGWGWALWNFRGDFGPLDSGRSDVDYEDFGGHRLDRKMLELLRKY